MIIVDLFYAYIRFQHHVCSDHLHCAGLLECLGSREEQSSCYTQDEEPATERYQSALTYEQAYIRHAILKGQANSSVFSRPNLEGSVKNTILIFLVDNQYLLVSDFMISC